LFDNPSVSLGFPSAVFFASTIASRTFSEVNPADSNGTD
jgi:hypothetical protein